MNALPLGRGLVFAALLGSSALAQDPPTDPPAQDPPTRQELQNEIRQLREQIQAMINQGNLDALRIQELEDRIGDLEQAAAAQPEQPQDPVDYVDPGLQDPSFDPFQTTAITGGGQGNLLNPNLTVFTDILGGLSDNGDNKRNNRFSLREVELDARAAITPWVDGLLILALPEEIEQDPADGGDIEIENPVEIEEAFVNFHTLPGEFAVKAGQFRNRFGRNNVLHIHDLPQVDRPLATTAFFGGEGLITTGVGIDRIVTPESWDTYVNVALEVVDSDSGAESPVLGGPNGANAENPALVGRVTLFQDVSQTSWFELGGSALYGHWNETGTDLDSMVYGLDFTFQWLNPDLADWNSILVQTELYWSDMDVDNAFLTGNQDSFGWYAFGQYQWSQNWYAGVRYDWTEFPNSEFRAPTEHDWAVSPYITWYLTEFLRLRLEYQHLERGMAVPGFPEEEEIFLLNLTAVFGSHPPHPYWVNR